MKSVAPVLFFFAVATFVGAGCAGIDEPDFFSPAVSIHRNDAGPSGTIDAGYRDSGSSADGGDNDAGSDGDSGVFTPDPGIYCGTNQITNNPIYCTGTQICCASNGELGAPTYNCTSAALCGSALGNLAIPCDDSQECGGRKCCGTFVTGTPSHYSQVSCVSSCTGDSARTFCDPSKGNADCDGVGTCEASGTLPGFHVCSN